MGRSVATDTRHIHKMTHDKTEINHTKPNMTEKYKPLNTKKPQNGTSL